MPKSGLNATDGPGLPDERPIPGSGAGSCRIRALTHVDLPAVASIERRSFSSPWSAAMLALELSRPTGVALVAADGERIVGCVIATRYDRAWHLMKIAVEPSGRRQGIGSRLLSAVLERIGDGIPVTLEVRPSNLAAIALYRNFGFVGRGRRPSYYPDNGEDALLMWRGDPELAGVPAESLEPARG